MTKLSISLLIASAWLGFSSTSAAGPAENALLHRLMSQQRRRLQPPPRDGDGGGGAGMDAPDDGEADTCEAEDLPCACELLGDVGFTSASGTVPGTNTFLDVGENIYGPFEAGFNEQQKDLFLQLGCTEDNVEGAYVVGGIDTHTVVSIINEACDISIPYTDGEGTYRDLLDQCGGHTTEYVPRVVCSQGTLSKLTEMDYCLLGVPLTHDDDRSLPAAVVILQISLSRTLELLV